jgi:hypothetical protein
VRAGRDEAFHDFVVSTRGDLLRTATLLAAGAATWRRIWCRSA